MAPDICENLEGADLIGLDQIIAGPCNNYNVLLNNRISNNKCKIK